MNLTKWASDTVRSIREITPDKPDTDDVGGVPDQEQPKSKGSLQDEDWFEEPAEPKGVPSNGKNGNRSDPDDPTGTDSSFEKLNGSEVSGSGSGRQLERRKSYHS